MHVQFPLSSTERGSPNFLKLGGSDQKVTMSNKIPLVRACSSVVQNATLIKQRPEVRFLPRAPEEFYWKTNIVRFHKVEVYPNTKLFWQLGPEACPVLSFALVWGSPITTRIWCEGKIPPTRTSCFGPVVQLVECLICPDLKF